MKIRHMTELENTWTGSGPIVAFYTEKCGQTGWTYPAPAAQNAFEDLRATLEEELSSRGKNEREGCAGSLDGQGSQCAGNLDGQDLQCAEFDSGYKSEGPDGGHLDLSQFVRTNQRHTANIRVVTAEDAGRGVIREVGDEEIDGLVTDVRGLALCTVEADCVPLYITDMRHGAIGMVHSGWRGTAAEIVLRALDTMAEHYGTEASDVHVAIGPHMCGNCYEVKEDVYEAFGSNFSLDERALCFAPIDNGAAGVRPEGAHATDGSERVNTCNKTQENGRDGAGEQAEAVCAGSYLLDMTAAIRLSLARYGVPAQNVHDCDVCTFEDEALCSWRRLATKEDLMLTGIMMCE